MKTLDLSDLDLNIARARVALSLVALPLIYLDPTAGGPFFLETQVLIILSLHLAYSLGTYGFLRYGRTAPAFAIITATIDVAFATVIAILTEGPTSPAYIFFAFAVIAVGCRHGFRATLLVTAYGVLLYVPLIVFPRSADREIYVMRAIYLAIIGYLLSFLGEQRLYFEERLRALRTTSERRTIARSLHDGYVQALAGVNLRLKTSRALLGGGRSSEGLAELDDLQAGVVREYDEVRQYIRSLAELDESAVAVADPPSDTRFEVRAAFATSGMVLEQILQILLEGMRNTRKHGRARTAAIEVSQTDGSVRIAIDDDGIGFQKAEQTPWSIASRVDELGGKFRIAEEERLGAHIRIELPIVP